MLLVNIWIYTLLLVIVWGFFVVLKIHAYKFKNFSNHIIFVTRFLFIFILALSLLWYFLIIFWMDYVKFEIDLSEKIENNWDYSEIDY